MNKEREYKVQRNRLNLIDNAIRSGTESGVYPNANKLAKLAFVPKKCDKLKGLLVYFRFILGFFALFCYVIITYDRKRDPHPNR